MKILGISAFYHDSAATITDGNVIIAAAQEERFSRKKHDSGFPKEAIRYCLEESGFSIDELDAVAFYDKPLLKFERLLETYYENAPAGIKSFIKAMPVWLNEKMFLKRLILGGLSELERFDKSSLKLLFPEHHLSHAASAYYPSPFKEAAIVTIDGVGEWATSSICYAKDEEIKVVKELHFPNSVGLLYSSFTYFLGFRVNSGEYKLMGLAPYGIQDSEELNKFEEIIKEEILDLKEDGSINLNRDYFRYSTGLRMINDARWEKIFGINKRNPDDEINQKHCNLALAIQNITEEIIFKIVSHAKEITNADNLCLAGGVALNCVANGKVLKQNLFEDLFIQPAAGDAGGSLGACLAAEYIYFKQKRSTMYPDSMNGAYLGPKFDDKAIDKVIRKYDGKSIKTSEKGELVELVSGFLADGKVVGWFQGRMEFGPRALGNRSILGDATNTEMQKKLNLKIKYRESFRPFAPIVLEEDCSNIFDLKKASPYMLIVAEIKDELKKKVPRNYFELEMRDRLYTERSVLQAITHVDFSGRIQTVSKDRNKLLWLLLTNFKQKKGFGVLVNTSFNVRGEPIVCTPDDAYRCFMRTEMDYLVMGNYIFNKQMQPNWDKKDNWKEEFKLD